MKAFSVTHVGYVRKVNEDSYLALPRQGIFAVADGMGGHQAGEIASKIAVESLEENAGRLFKCVAGETADVLVAEIHNVNKKIMQEGLSLRVRKGIGTTLTVLLIKDAKAIIGHVGDSRVYLWRDKVLTQLTEDHSVVAELVRIGQLTEEEAREHPNRNVLSRALGMSDELQVDCVQAAVAVGDVFLLTSDGVTNLVYDHEIAHVFAGGIEGKPDEEPWQTYLDSLSQLILARGANDNFTAVCCVVEPEDLVEQPTHPTVVDSPIEDTAEFVLESVEPAVESQE
ncbi:MAG: Stp1/IreP family PP2C-type Ser/Thr phosphatase [Peptococcaceae bacterium]|jgi:protein phosphatase|nr:Stp1/IreP family PP2C-type Ser/Thr phosphatase [Peptococcaceae bacterium]